MIRCSFGINPLSLLFAGLVSLTLVVANTTAQAEDARPLSFVNDIAPILTKAGCNAGACHAKAGNGQNGFRLSLLGFEPTEDYEHIVKESHGRRVSPAAPQNSLIVLKATNTVPHGGGKRIELDSKAAQHLIQWIGQGMPYDHPGDPTLVAIEVQPPRSLLQPGTQEQLKVVAHYSDKSTRDVTDLSLFEPNNRSMAEVGESGLVKVSSIPGSVAIMVRYQGRVAVSTAFVPLGAKVENLPTPKNFVDELVFANLKEIGIPPSAICDDATFIRRVTIDIAGRLPSSEETREFLASKELDKRDQLIETLLSSPGYADYFANKWSALLKNRRDETTDKTANFAFHSWIRDSLLMNKPYDQLVRELLGATGDVVSNPAVAWYKRVKEPEAQLEDVAQLFLGVRMQCAQCHHHPFERWSQGDYYSLAAFFSRIGRKATSTPGEDVIFHQRGIAQAENKKTHEQVKPAALGDPPFKITPDEDPRLYLADWMSEPENPFFAKSFVNRYWKHFFKRGLIEPEDDIRDTNPPSNPELLNALAEHFVRSGFDMKEIVRVITRSQTYQLSSIPNEFNLVDQQNFSRFYPRHLIAEVLLDSVDQLAGTQTSFPDLPAGTLAVSLPDNSYNRNSYFLSVFGRPEGSSVCECEREESSSLAQSLHLMNSDEIKNKLHASTGRAAAFSKDPRSPAEKLTELYLVAYSRLPAPEELQVAESYLAKPQFDAQGKQLNDQQALQIACEDLIWAIMNTKEFLYNH